MLKKTEKDLDYYLSLDYKTIIEPIPENEGGGFEAHNPTLGKSTCVAVGDTQLEALSELEEARKCLFVFWLEKGIDIPESNEESTSDIPYSGKILLRTTPEMHQSLVESAKKQGVSLNLFLNQAINLGYSCKVFENAVKTTCDEIPLSKESMPLSKVKWRDEEGPRLKIVTPEYGNAVGF